MSSPFYPPEMTALSRQVLDEVIAVVPEAILIGGWGTWLRCGGDMSHDIDLIVTQTDMAILRGHVSDLSESRHIAQRKWRATWRTIHLDLYVPYQSVLGGRLEMPVERLARHTETVNGRWRLLTVDAHITTKLAALLGRPREAPGRKDRVEIRNLLRLGGAGTPAVLLDASNRTPAELAQLVSEAFGYIGEIPGLSRGERGELRQVRASWISALGG